jgi:hypothetical protein
MERGFNASHALYEEATLGSAGCSAAVEEQLLQCATQLHAQLKRVAELCRTKWVAFDLGAMKVGIAVMLVACVAFAANVALLIRKQQQQQRLRVSPRAALWGLLLAEAALLVCYDHINSLIVVLASVVSPLLASLLPSVLGRLARLVQWQFTKGMTLQACVVLLVWLAYAQGLFSNSFIVEEPHVVLFLFASCWACGLVARLRRCGGGGSSSVCALTCWACIGPLARLVVAVGSPASSSPSPDQHLFDVGSSTWHVAVQVLSLIVLAALYLVLSKRWKCALLYSAVLGATLLFWTLHDDDAAFHRVRKLLARAVFSTCTLRVLALFCINNSNRKSSGGDGYAARMTALLFYCAVPVLLVLGPTSPLIVLALFVMVLLFALSSADTDGGSSSSSSNDVVTMTTMLWLVALHLFFVSGHRNDFGAMQYSAAFVGFDTFQYYVAALLVLLNTFGMHLLVVLAIPVLHILIARQRQRRRRRQSSSSSSSSSKGGRVLSMCIAAAAADDDDDESKAKNVVSESLQLFVLLFLARASVSTVNVAIQRRHLMVWAIFAPKFAFDAASFLAVLAFAAVCAAFQRSSSSSNNSSSSKTAAASAVAASKSL